MSGKVKVDLVDPDKLTEETRIPVLRACTKVIAKRARVIVPKGSGPAVNRKGEPRKRLAKTIRSSVTKKGKVAKVTANAPHAWLVHNGTQAHWIKPSKSKHLKINGSVITGAVWHPGAKAQPYLKDAAEDSRSDIAAAIRNIV